MPAPGQRLGERATDKPVRAGQQDAHGWRDLVWRTLCTGTLASLASTAVIALQSRRRTRSWASGTNATSHWMWGAPAKLRRRTDLRHTALGYGIHHASSLFWASAYVRWLRARHPPPAVPAAAAVATLAYVVDYHVVPRRLTPGFRRHLGRGGLFATYAAFAGGLVAGALYRRWRDTHR